MSATVIAMAAFALIVGATFFVYAALSASGGADRREDRELALRAQRATPGRGDAYDYEAKRAHMLALMGDESLAQVKRAYPDFDAATHDPRSGRGAA